MQDAKKILITGGAGFIGTHLARALTDKDYQVSILDNLSAQVHGRSSRFSGTGFKKIRFITRTWLYILLLKRAPVSQW
jgi:dTDP-L-rhamnose 4-epimerase